MVGNGQDGNAVRLGGLALVLQGVDSVEELLLEKDEGALSMLESTLVAAELRQDSACVEVGVGGVVDLFEAALDLESFLEVLEGRMEFSLAAIVAGQVIECYSPTGGVPLREDLSLLQELQHHSEILLLQVRHGQKVAHLAHHLARTPDLIRISTEKVLTKYETTFHAF